jgi:hypothetical protein
MMKSHIKVILRDSWFPENSTNEMYFQQNTEKEIDRQGQPIERTILNLPNFCRKKKKRTKTKRKERLKVFVTTIS